MTTPFEQTGLREECGVFGIIGDKDAAAHAVLGLHALQHRGQEASGLVTCQGERFFAHRAMGLVGDNFNNAAIMNELVGAQAIGHVRYSTAGEGMLRNVQPLFAEMHFGGVALAHNGNLTNAISLRKKLIEQGCIFQSTSDTEVIIHLMATSKKAMPEERLIDALEKVEGAYSLLMMVEGKVVAVRDPHGVRPLVIGKRGDTHLVASESCAFDILGGETIRDVKPGEMVVMTEEGITSSHPFTKKTDSRFCLFEYIYFSRPDSIAENRSVYESRKYIGMELARESHIDADIVVPVPDSGVPAAIGYATEANLPFDLGIIRNHYVGRTFIEPTQNVRNLGVKLKHNANRRMLAGKRVVLVDDSIVRGTTSKKIVQMVREAGATEVHMRIASPPTTHSCFYGVDTPSRKQLLAAQHSVEEIAKIINVDSLAFLTLDGLYRAVGEASGRNAEKPQFCDACFTGEYPIPRVDKDCGEKLSKKPSRLAEI